MPRLASVHLGDAVIDGTLNRQNRSTGIFEIRISENSGDSESQNAVQTYQMERYEFMDYALTPRTRALGNLTVIQVHDIPKT